MLFFLTFPKGQFISFLLLFGIKPQQSWWFRNGLDKKELIHIKSYKQLENAIYFSPKKRKKCNKFSLCRRLCSFELFKPRISWNFQIEFLIWGGGCGVVCWASACGASIPSSPSCFTLGPAPCLWRGKAAKDDQSPWVPPPIWESPKKLHAPGF